MQTVYYTHVSSPVGPLLVAGDQKAIKYISFPTGKTTIQPDSTWVQDGEPLQEAIKQLEDYFEGKQKQITFPIAPEGTPFQQKVWKALQEIPYGKTVSYGAIARKIGNPKASRAVGAANGKNPIPIIIPCHRVVGSTGQLTGFGGGIPTKKILLELEQKGGVSE